MTSAPGILEQHPAARREIVLGPALWRGTAPVSVVLDPRCGRRYELSGKLRFVLVRLDGRRTLADIGEEYRRAFGVRLDERGWVRILTALGSRRLLAGGPEAQPAPPVPRPPYPRTPRYGRVALLDPSRLPASWDGVLRPLFTPASFGCAAVMFPAVATAVAWHRAVLYADCAELLRRPLLLVPVALLLFVTTALHEVAHGMAARRFGGAATEIGVVWFLPVVFPYCEVEGVSFFASRWHRAATAAAGAFANVLTLLPFAALWWWSPPGGEPRLVAGGFLLAGSLAAVGNLLPLPGLDGYRVLSDLFNMTELAAESRRYLRLRIGRITGGSVATLAYPRWARRVYGGYPLLAVGAVGAFFYALGDVCFRVGAPVVGPTAVTVVVSLMAAAVLATALVRGARRGTR